MKLENEQKETYCKFDIDLTELEYKDLVKYGREHIQNDEPELVNYAVNHMLRKMVEKKELKDYLDKAVEKINEDKNDKE